MWQRSGKTVKELLIFPLAAQTKADKPGVNHWQEGHWHVWPEQ